MIYSDAHVEPMMPLDDIQDLEYLSLATPRVTVTLTSGHTLRFHGDDAQRVWLSFVAARRAEYADGCGSELLPWGSG